MPTGEKQKLLWQDLRYRTRQLASFRNSQHSNEHLIVLTEAARSSNSARPLSVEHRQKLSDSARSYWAGLSKNEVYKLTSGKVFLMSNLSGPTQIEILLAAQIEFLELKFIPQFPIPPYRVDFYLPEHNLVIEADGEYWHQEDDPERDYFIESQGFRILHLSGSKIQGGSEQEIQLALLS